MRMQYYGPAEGVIVGFVQTIELERQAKPACIRVSNPVLTQRGATATYLVTVLSSHQPILVASAVRHQPGRPYRIAFKAINKKTVLPRGEAHIHEETGGGIEMVLNGKCLCLGGNELHFFVYGLTGRAFGADRSALVRGLPLPVPGKKIHAKKNSSNKKSRIFRAGIIVG
jgi:hypothetical protein